MFRQESGMQDKFSTKYSGCDELINCEVMVNYNHSIVEAAVKSADTPTNCIDFGAGIGTLSIIFREKFGIEPQCVEIDEKNIRHLRDRKFKTVSKLSTSLPNAGLIFSSNVLEHIEDDVDILKSMEAALDNKGIVFLYLPANMVLWTQMDVAVGHYRRYNIKDLRIKCQEAGLKITKIHYADSIGFFASLVMKLVGYNGESGMGSVTSLKFYDKFIFPFSKWLDRFGLKYFFGKNIIVVANKITSAEKPT